jgi:hypothetical protein
MSALPGGAGHPVGRIDPPPARSDALVLITSAPLLRRRRLVHARVSVTDARAELDRELAWPRYERSSRASWL